MILGGGGLSTSRSEDEDREWDLDRLCDLDLDLVTLMFEGESQRDFEWYPLLLSSSSDSCFSTSRFTPNLISSVSIENYIYLFIL